MKNQLMLSKDSLSPVWWTLLKQIGIVVILVMPIVFGAVDAQAAAATPEAKDHHGILAFLLGYLAKNPFVYLFLTLALGYPLGRIKFKGLSLGSAAGTLVIGIIIALSASALFGIKYEIPGLVEDMFLLMFMYALGMRVGPQFFSGLARGGLDFLVIGLIVALTNFAVVFFGVKLVGLEPGYAAGVHMAAIAVTGGAIGVAVGIGFQKIGSNMVSGMMLLLKKPIQQGDVVAFEKSYANAGWGWITDIGLLYVKVATRSGVLLLIPNEDFLTHKIDKLNCEGERLRLSLPFGISYTSDLKKAITLAVAAANKVDRVLKAPVPKCLVTAFGESTVNLELRVWISDPKNGMGSLKNMILLSLWDSFHENGIEIAFPQRDLHIKSAVPFQIIGDDLIHVKKAGV